MVGDGYRRLEAMLQRIEKARNSVAPEFYLCKPGAVADRFRMALVAARLRGVRVQVLLDAFGSDGVASGYWRELERCGGQLRWFNPKRLLRLTFRNHRKLLVTDRVTAIVGGFRQETGPARTASSRPTGLKSWRMQPLR